MMVPMPPTVISSRLASSPKRTEKRVVRCRRGRPVNDCGESIEALAWLRTLGRTPRLEEWRPGTAQAACFDSLANADRLERLGGHLTGDRVGAFFDDVALAFLTKHVLDELAAQ